MATEPSRTFLENSCKNKNVASQAIICDLACHCTVTISNQQDDGERPRAMLPFLEWAAAHYRNESHLRTSFVQMNAECIIQSQLFQESDNTAESNGPQKEYHTSAISLDRAHHGRQHG